MVAPRTPRRLEGARVRALGSARAEPGVLVHADDDRLRRLAVLDAVINNADRKGGHLLPARRRPAATAIDHGVTFNAETKLRTAAVGLGGGAAAATRRSRCWGGWAASSEGELGARLGR